MPPTPDVTNTVHDAKPQVTASMSGQLKIMQQQVGHSYASTTALYTSVSSDFRNRALRAALDRSIQAALGGDAGCGTGDR